MQTAYPRGPRATAYAPHAFGRHHAGFSHAHSQHPTHRSAGYNVLVGRPWPIVNSQRHTNASAARGPASESANKKWVNTAPVTKTAAGTASAPVNLTVVAGAPPPRVPTNKLAAPRPMPGHIPRPSFAAKAVVPSRGHAGPAAAVNASKVWTRQPSPPPSISGNGNMTWVRSVSQPTSALTSSTVLSQQPVAVSTPATQLPAPKVAVAKLTAKPSVSCTQSTDVVGSSTRITANVQLTPSTAQPVASSSAITPLAPTTITSQDATPCPMSHQAAAALPPRSQPLQAAAMPPPPSLGTPPAASSSTTTVTATTTVTTVKSALSAQAAVFTPAPVPSRPPAPVSVHPAVPRAAPTPSVRPLPPRPPGPVQAVAAVLSSEGSQAQSSQGAEAAYVRTSSSNRQLQRIPTSAATTTVASATMVRVKGSTNTMVRVKASTIKQPRLVPPASSVMQVPPPSQQIVEPPGQLMGPPAGPPAQYWAGKSHHKQLRSLAPGAGEGDLAIASVERAPSGASPGAARQASQRPSATSPGPVPSKKRRSSGSSAPSPKYAKLSGGKQLHRISSKSGLLVGSSTHVQPYKVEGSAGGAAAGPGLAVAKSGRRRSAVASGVGVHGLRRPLWMAQGLVRAHGVKPVGKVVKSRVTTAQNKTLRKGRQSAAGASKKLEPSNELCYPFIKYGRCWKHQENKCPDLHDRTKVRVCNRFLQGKCEEKDCPLAHEIKPDQMPDCSHFVRGCRCIRDDCPYRHVKFAWGAESCEDFTKGYCPKGRECRRPHKLPEKKRKLTTADMNALEQEGGIRKHPRSGNDGIAPNSHPRHNSGNRTSHFNTGESGSHQVDAVPPGGGAGSVHRCEPLHREQGSEEFDEDSSTIEEEEDDWDDDEFLPKFESRAGQDDEEDW